MTRRKVAPSPSLSAADAHPESARAILLLDPVQKVNAARIVSPRTSSAPCATTPTGSSSRSPVANPNLTAVTVPNAGHSVNRDDPERVLIEALWPAAESRARDIRIVALYDPA